MTTVTQSAGEGEIRWCVHDTQPIVGTQYIHGTPLTPFALIVLSLVFFSKISGSLRSKHDTFETICMQILAHKSRN